MKILMAILLLWIPSAHAATEDYYKFSQPSVLRVDDLHHAECIPNPVWVVSKTHEREGIKFPEFVYKDKQIIGIKRTPIGLRNKWIDYCTVHYKHLEKIQTTAGDVIWDKVNGWNKDIFK